MYNFLISSATISLSKKTPVPCCYYRP